MKLGNRHLVVLLLASSAIGCARSSPPPAFCAVALPIYVAEEDQFTDKTADQILEHNLIGQRLCKWGQ